MRVCLLGHRGMLGHVVGRFFREAGVEVHTVEERFSSANCQRFIEQIRSGAPDWWINCAGVGPGRGATEQQMWESNVDLVQACAEKLAPGIGLIHASTDGVFAPGTASRRSTEAPDATDAYGRSKQQAEAAVLRQGGTVLRCSIIGPEPGLQRNLLEWIFRQRNSIPGYANHWWNGVTTLEWAKVALRLVNRELERPEEGIVQPGFLPAMTKFELIQRVIEEWQLPVQAHEKEAPEPVIRSLMPNLTAPPLQTQLKELRRWYYLPQFP